MFSQITHIFDRQCFTLVRSEAGRFVNNNNNNNNMDALMKEVKIGMGRREQSGDCLAYYMQMTWFCVVSWRKT